MHKCVRCDKIYDAESLELKEGCGCGSKVFVYVQGELEAGKLGDTRWIERELASIVKKTNAPITLEVENVRVLRRGIFELDIQSLVKNPLVVRDEDGVYYIRLGSKSKHNKA